MKKYKKGGPVYIGGDFNADIQSTDSSRESKTVGPHTFDKEHENIITDPAMAANRDELIEFCEATGYNIINTWYKKTAEQMITWRHPGTKPHHDKTRGHYAVTDYWLVPYRWRNSITKCGSMHDHNINTDHYPLIINIRVTLHAI